MTTNLPTTCWECGTCCGAIAQVEHGRVVRLGPNPEHPASRGAFCAKGIRGLPELTYGAQRITHPLRRVGPRGSNQWERISWEEALDAMAQGFARIAQAHGPQAIAGAVSGGYYSRGVVVALLLRAIGSPNWLINQDLCRGGSGVSDMVTGLGITGGEDIEYAAGLLIVGSNPYASSPIWWARLKAAKARGARFVVLDPLETPTSKLADIWLRPAVGTDAAIGLAFLHLLIGSKRHDQAFVERWTHGFAQLAERVSTWTPERAAQVSGVPAAQIRAAAEIYFAGPSVFIAGHGIDAASNAVQTFRVFHSLVAVSGNLDRKGGNRRAKRPTGYRAYADLIHDPRFQLPDDIDALTLGIDRFPLWSGKRGWQTASHNPSVIDAMLTGKPYPVRGMYVSGVNIAVTYPNSKRTVEALRSLDFLAVALHVMNPTAAVADVILPKTTTLEEEEISINTSGPCITWTAALSDRIGEVRPDIEIAAGLLDAMERYAPVNRHFMPWRTQRELNAFVTRDAGIDFDQLARVGYSSFDFTRGDFDQQVFNTPSGKVELFSSRMKQAGLDPLPDFCPTGASQRVDPDFPLRLLTGLREKSYHHSRFHDQAWARKTSPDPLIKLHPETAQILGVADGDWVRLYTADGPAPCRLRADVTPATPVDTVATGMGWWLPEAAGPEFGMNDINVNVALHYDGPFDPASGAPDARGIPCRIERAAHPL